MSRKRFNQSRLALEAKQRHRSEQQHRSPFQQRLAAKSIMSGLAGSEERIKLLTLSMVLNYALSTDEPSRKEIAIATKNAEEIRDILREKKVVDSSRLVTQTPIEAIVKLCLGSEIIQHALLGDGSGYNATGSNITRSGNEIKAYYPIAAEKDTILTPFSESLQPHDLHVDPISHLRSLNPEDSSMYFTEDGIDDHEREFYTEEPAKEELTQPIALQPTYNDALNWLNQFSAIPYGMLVLTAAKNPFIATAIAAGSYLLPSAEAFSFNNIVVEKGYETTVYCGPDIFCQNVESYLNSQPGKKSEELVYFDRGGRLKKTINAERAILNMHGDEHGELTFTNSKNYIPNLLIRDYFPNAKVVHLLSCYSGLDSSKTSPTKAGQIIFTHNTGELSLQPALEEASLSLLKLADSNFPHLISMKIQAGYGYTVKNQLSSKNFNKLEYLTAILESIPLKTIKDALIYNSGVDDLYKSITQHVHNQRVWALEEFKSLPNAKKIISSELDKLGIKSYEGILMNPDQKADFVRKYVKNMLSFFIFNAKVNARTIHYIIESDLFVELFRNHKQDLSLIVTALAENNITGFANLIPPLKRLGADLKMDDYVINAAKGGHIDAIKVLINEEGIQIINQEYKGGFTPLYKAAEKGQLETVKFLLKLEWEETNEYVELEYDATSTMREKRLAKKMMVDLNKALNDGTTPLFIAAQNGHFEVVQSLIDADADVNLIRGDGVSPLLIALEKGHIEMVKTLTKAGANVNLTLRDGTSPLFIVAEKGHIEAAKALIDADADVNLIRGDGVSPLLIALENGHFEVVQSLIDADADVNLIRGDGVSPLLIAVEKGHIEMVKTLIKAGADVNKARNDEVTPSVMAASYGKFEILLILASNGADPNLPTRYGSPIEIAVREKCSDEMLEKIRSAYEEYKLTHILPNPSPEVMQSEKTSIANHDDEVEISR